MTPTQRAALDMVLRHYGDDPRVQPLRELTQEPVAALHDDGHFSWKSDEARRQFDSKHEHEGWSMDVYAAPPQRQPLSDEQINKHALLAKDCPPNSAVMLVSSIRRLQIGETK